MYLGTYVVDVAASGGLAVPAPFLGGVVTGLVATRGDGRHLLLLPVQRWSALAEDVAAAALLPPRLRALRRHLFSAAVPLTPDQSGKIVLPRSLRTYAQISDQAVLVGLYDHMELWEPAAWSEMEAGVVAGNQQLWDELAL